MSTLQTSGFSTRPEVSWTYVVGMRAVLAQGPDPCAAPGHNRDGWRADAICRKAGDRVPHVRCVAIGIDEDDTMQRRHSLKSMTVHVGPARRATQCPLYTLSVRKKILKIARQWFP